MGSTFGSYSTAYSGMYVNQAALTTTSNNLANINTTGASRVRVASTENVTVANGTSTGTGVNVASITRARDQYLDSTYRRQNSQNSYLSVKSGNLQYSDKVLTEFDTTSKTTDSTTTTTTTSGVQTAVDNFFKKWDTLSTDASTDSTRKAVTDAATTLVSMLTNIDGQLQQLQTDAVNGAKDGVKSLNELAGQVADLNGQITQAEAGGGEASYLRDQRDTLLDSMSSLADISTTTQGDGTLQVTLGGRTLVSGATSHELIITGGGTTTNPLTVEIDDGQHSKVKIRSGSIGAYLEDADQTGYQTIDSSTLPYDLKTTAASSISTMRQSLNDLITTLAIKVNSLSTSGVDQNGNAGLDFFTPTDASQPLSITNIQVNPKLTADSGKVVTGSSSASGDNTIANKISDLKSDTSCYQHGGVSLDITDFYKEVTSWIGTAGDTAKNSYASQTSLVQQVDAKRQETFSISLDEEMSNMMREQKAYSASAQVLNTLDSLIEGLIEDLD